MSAPTTVAPTTVAIICYDDFTDIDVFLPWDVLNRVPQHMTRSGWRVRLLGDKSHHTSFAGLTIPMHGPLEDANAADAVIFTSGKGARRVIKDERWLGRFRLDPKKQLVSSMCTGAAILAKLGLLKGLTATTYPTSVELLRSMGVTVVEEPMVVHGNVATAAGCLAGQYLTRWIVESLVGAAAAEAALASIRPVGEGCVALPAAPAKTPKPEGLTGGRERAISGA
jgi:transcriptional regulator GlxA family with amidase domain